MEIMWDGSLRNTANENIKRCYLEPGTFILVLEFEEI